MLKDNNTRLFLLMTFALMYISSLLTIILLRTNIFLFTNPIIQILQFIAGGSPTIVAFYIIYYQYNKERRKNFLSRLLKFNISPIWWLYAIALPFLIMIFLQFLTYQNLNHISFELSSWLKLPLILLISVFAGGLEEIGWRGVLFDEMKDKYSITILTLIIGILWSLWHLPLFFIEELAFSDKNILLYFLSTIMFSGFLSLLIMKTKSIALAVLMHASINTAGNYGDILPVNHGVRIYLGLVILIFTSLYMIYKIETEDEANII
ncbi:MAG: CPBP family intramembrane metalloprotease [Halanaerobiales bacterium]|nr:CPBP family intramembrane metalloprotease [Halanaerobiales bacterium]